MEPNELLKMLYNNTITINMADEFIKMIEDKEFDFDAFQKNMLSYKIQNLIENRKIKNLIHFTKFENVSSILQFGFLSRKYLYDNHIPFDYNDKERRDDKLDSICFSVEFPNNFLLSKFKQLYPNANFAIFVVDVNILTDIDIDKSFCMYNAGGCAKWLNNPRCKDIKAFRNIFDDNGAYTRSHLPDYLPTNVQAEILLEGQIKPNNITKIVFETGEDLAICKEKYVTEEILNKYNPIVDNRYFGYRDDFIWENR